MIQTIPNNCGNELTIEYQPSFSAHCRIGNSPFFGNINIVYRPLDVLLEFESFEKWLREKSMREVTIEEFTRICFNELAEVLGHTPLRVQVFAETLAHSPVTVTIERILE